MKYSEQLSVTTPWGEHRRLSGFLDSNVGKIRLKIVKCSGCSSYVRTDEKVEKVRKSQRRLMKHHFGDRRRVTSLARNTPVNSNGGLEHVTDLREVCASDTHRRAEAVACLPRTIWWSQKRLKLPLEGHNRRQNLPLSLRPRNQTSVLSVEKPVHSTPEESQASQVEQRQHVRDIYIYIYIYICYCESTVDQKLVPQGQTVNRHYYRMVSQRLVRRNDGGTILVDPTWQCAGAHCFVSAATSGR
jgi:hypothetical protein